jgi:hypothetical protein
MTHYVVFPFGSQTAAEEFLDEQREQGWSGIVLDIEAERYPRPKLVIVEEKETHSMHVKHLEG